MMSSSFLFLSVVLLALENSIAISIYHENLIEDNSAVVKRFDETEKDHYRKCHPLHEFSDVHRRDDISSFDDFVPSDESSDEDGGYYSQYPKELNNIVQGERQIQRNSSWGLAMISHKDRSDTREYVYNKAINKDVMIYIIDAGCLPDHEEYKGRMRFNVDHSQFDSDELRHGTGVASIAGGNRLGVAKDAELVSVSFSSYCQFEIDAMDWILEDLQKPENRNKKALINMSREVQNLPPIRERLQKFLDLEIPLVFAAGNNETNECADLEFLRHELIVLVSSVDEHYDKFTPALYGECIDVFAPGGKMEMADSVATDSYIGGIGTSFAAPYVAGVIAYLWGQNSSLSSQEVIEKAIHGRPNTIKEGKLKGSPNFLVYNGAA